MSTYSHILPNKIEDLTQQQLLAALNRCLHQAEALAVIVTIIDTEAVEPETMNHYLWALSDMVQEARWLCGHLVN